MLFKIKAHNFLIILRFNLTIMLIIEVVVCSCVKLINRDFYVLQSIFTSVKGMNTSSIAVYLY